MSNKDDAAIAITGNNAKHRYGRLETIGEPYSVAKWGRSIRYVRVRCDCGTEQEKRLDDMRRTKEPVTSCGCLQRETFTRETHGQTGTRLYAIYKGMQARCSNPNVKAYKSYGGRGITVCDEWQEFPAFQAWALANGYTEELTIDRIDNDKGYEPENCRWVTMAQQMANQKQIVMITAFGETKYVRQWSKDSRCRVSEKTLRKRIRMYGWDAEEAITKPPRIIL